MNGPEKANLAASVRQRLLNVSQRRGVEFQRVLRQYAQERLLYRLSRSEYHDRFTLKGALLFTLWSPEVHRSTKDLDLLGRGSPAIETVVEIFRVLCATEVEPDGLVLHPDTVHGSEIREMEEYGGVRVTFLAVLDHARIPMQVDVGFGDPITPEPMEVDFPVLLDLPAPRLRVYPPETVIAEKLEAMVSLGLDNSRMKDFFDLWLLSHRFEFDGRVLASAVAATFRRRGTRVPVRTPVALTDAFSSDARKVTQWNAFLKRSAPTSDIPTLTAVVLRLSEFLLPIIQAIVEERELAARWSPEEGWRG
ncbi:MAG: nucleotidyl transferase AbiEii/AbiGii toxin family protein [Armatimonadota bacterium]